MNGVEPQLDAWLCVAGKKRDVFNARGFIKTYPRIKKKIGELRILCKFHVPSKEARRWEIPEEHSITATKPIKRNVPTSSDESDQAENVGESDHTENLINFDSIGVEKTPARKRRKTGRIFIKSDSETEKIAVELSAELDASSNMSSQLIKNKMLQEHSEAIKFKRGNAEYLMEKKVMIKIVKLSRDTCESRSYTRKCERSKSSLTLGNKTSVPPQICDLTKMSDEAEDSD